LLGPLSPLRRRLAPGKIEHADCRRGCCPIDTNLR
jgi:hypothetical protein